MGHLRECLGDQGILELDKREDIITEDSRERQNRRVRERMARMRQEWFKEHGPCAHCGSWENLEADHIDPKTKDPEASKVVPWSWSKARREIELAKCQALCRPCHIEKTRKEQAVVAKHGSLTMYVKRKCRCPECKSSYSVYQKNRRKWQ